MTEQLEPRVSYSGLEYLINHVFLPPKLPQQDDFNEEHESLLLDLVCQSLSGFAEKIDQQYRETVRRVHQSAVRMARVLDSSMVLNEKFLRTAMNELPDTEGTLPLFIKSQNAGLVLTVEKNDIIAQVFELTPPNSWIIGTEGRLRRQFPSSAVVLSSKRFEENGFVPAIAQALSNMSAETFVESYEKSQKTRHLHMEIRDTLHPKLISDYLVAILNALGKPATVVPLWKNTREEVLWSNCLQPWHRSALWLLIRVSLQLQFCQAADGKDNSLDLYKAFMIHFLSGILHQALRFKFSSSLYRVMIAKISQRLLKLDINPDCEWMTSTKLILLRANAFIDTRWKSVMGVAQPEVQLSDLSTLNPSAETNIQLLGLDKFIDGLAARKNHRALSEFVCNPFKYNPQTRQPPRGFNDAMDIYQIHALSVFEKWVEEDLQHWKATLESKLSTCKLINEMIRDYHKSATDSYRDNPESFSRMALTILELWIASDALTLEEYPMLQQYNTEVDPEILQCLVLPTVQEMKRMQDAEQYLVRRRAGYDRDLPSVFRGFGQRGSFAVKYFDQSHKHKDLLRSIETAAEEARRAKLEELAEKTLAFEDLMQSHDETFCEYIQVLVNSSRQIYNQQHSNRCQKCSYRKKARSLQISIHEWPVHRDRDIAKATVFELDVPVLFQEWRDITVYLLMDVFSFTYDAARGPNANNCYGLSADSSLSGHFVTSETNSNYITVMSTIKLNSTSHYSIKPIHSRLTSRSVCLDNGLVYQYFDRKRGSFVTKFNESEELPTSCRFVLPKRSKALQRFLVKLHGNPQGLAPNEVVASQHTCPDHMSLDEFEALALLPLGYLVQWHNVLKQLAMPSLDFAKQETTIMLSQVIYQAGPSVSEHHLRAAHEIVAEAGFAKAILVQLHQGLDRVKENWQSKWALQSYIQVARRCLSLLSSDQLAKAYLDFLGQACEVAYEWFCALHRRRQDSVDLKYREVILAHQVEVALLCADTLNVDSCHFEKLLNNQFAASRYIHCSLIIRENSMVIAKRTSFTSVLYQRWQRFAITVFAHIRDLITNKLHPCLDQAVSQYWSAYQRSTPWLQCAQPYSHWLETTSLANESFNLTVHFDLLSASLLVDGLPLSRLPNSYTSDSTYATVFGLHSLDVMPTSTHGMTFTAKERWHNYIVSFGMHSLALGSTTNSERLSVFAEDNSQRYDFIPDAVLENCLPRFYLEEFVYWYHHNSHCVILTPRGSPWNLTSPVWKMQRSHSSWNVRGEEGTLIDPRSRTASRISRILQPLEKSDYIHLILPWSSSPVTVHLPRIQLCFLYRPQSTILESKEFRNFAVDCDQTIGTLVGLKDKLVLRHRNSAKRTVLIPDGKVSFKRSSQHVVVFIEHLVAQVFHYRIDGDLRRLQDSGDLQSKVFLAYLHALTSYCCPDPFTGLTGTEQAITILQSGAVRSFQEFDARSLEILRLITDIVPTRQYYPLDKKEMQQIHWNTQLDPLTQDSLLIPPVQAIFKQIIDYSMFQGKDSLSPPSLEFGNEELLAKDLHRSSTYRASGFGKEYFDPSQDRIYSSRDRLPRSPGGQRVYLTTSFINRNGSSLFLKLVPQLRDHLWSVFNRYGPVRGNDPSLAPLDLSFNIKWLSKPVEALVPAWCHVIDSIKSMQHEDERFRFALWLSCLAFSENMDMQIIQLLGTCFLFEDIHNIPFPKAPKFQLNLGRQFKTTEIHNIIDVFTKPFEVSTEARLAARPGETNDSLYQRSKKLFDDKVERLTTAFIAHVSGQWPCKVPSLLRDTETLVYIKVDEAMVDIRGHFKEWHANLDFHNYLCTLEEHLESHSVQTIMAQQEPLEAAAPVQLITKRFIHTVDLFKAIVQMGSRKNLPV